MGAEPAPPPSVRTLVLAGAVLGATWAAGLRGWMIHMVGPESSQVHWLGTFGLLLAPGLVVGALLGLAEHRRRVGGARSWWLTLAPCLFLVGLADPKAGLVLLVTEGIGGGAIGVVLLGLAGGYALSGRGRAWWRRACGTLAVAGLLLMMVMAGDTAPLGTAYGVWVGLYASSLLAVLMLGCAVPQRIGRPRLVPRRSVALGVGAVCGLAWAATLRSFMWEVAGDGAGVQWAGTFVWVLLPGTVVGMLLAWGEHRRSSGPVPHRRWLVWSPMLFAAVLLQDPVALVGGFDGGIGLAAIAVPAMCMVGGYALARGGSPWLRGLAGLVISSAVPIWALTATDVGGSSLSLGSPHGAWAAVLFWGLLATFSMAAALPRASSPVVSTVAAPAQAVAGTATDRPARRPGSQRTA